MLEQILPLWDVYLKNKSNKQPLVMATIVNTNGSSYKKTGAMVLIDSQLKPYGLISGGCLETDLAEHAESLFIDSKPKLLNYDLSDDSIFGLGAGCDGCIQVLLQLINHNNNYQPFSLLNPLLDQAQNAVLSLCYDKNNKDFANYNYTPLNNNQDTIMNFAILNQSNKICNMSIKPPLKVAVIGTGQDVLPVCQQIEFMNWHGYVLDHRNSHLDSFNDFNNFKKIKCHLQQTELIEKERVHFDALIIMTHNIDRDAQYLQFFNQFSIPYIGLLGPINRRDKVLDKAHLKLTDLKNKLYAPIGIDIGCNTPEQIALSIVTEIHQQINNSRYT